MSKGNNKLKIIYIMKFFFEETDENNYVTIVDIIKYLNEFGIKAERKALYTDIDALREVGFDIKGFKERGNYYYHLVSRDFELAELKLLVDLVKASKFITSKKSEDLIKKLSRLTSKYDAKKLKRHVHIERHVKTYNENIYYNVDKLHNAINNNMKISFKYYKWNLDKRLVAKKAGSLYRVSPWALMWRNENYYMIGFDYYSNIIKHYRVDKMKNIQFLKVKREGEKEFKGIELLKYPKGIFGMYSGEVEIVRLECRNNLVGVIIDRFGRDIHIKKIDMGRFSVDVEIQVSKKFLAWVIGLGDGIKIMEPKYVVEMMKEEGRRIVEDYG